MLSPVWSNASATLSLQEPTEDMCQCQHFQDIPTGAYF